MASNKYSMKNEKNPMRIVEKKLKEYVFKERERSCIKSKENMIKVMKGKRIKETRE